jgi:cell division protein FtsN
MATRADTTHAAAPPAAKPVPAAAVAAPPVARAQTDSVSTYGIAVGTYMDEARAQAERERMMGTTGLPARLIPYRDSGVTMYRLVLGSWTSESAAENRATQLVDGSQVREARVLLLGRGPAR